jgi:hypothetical protein
MPIDRQMNWIRTHYDQFAVLVAALFLFLCALFIWRHASQFEEKFSAARTALPPKKAGPLPNVTALEEAAQQLRQPAQWTFGGRSGLFVPEKHFIGADGLPATLRTTEVHPPVPNEWLEQFALPIADADVLAQDPDGDGFSNLDEWQFHSNPTEKNSHPDYLTKLKMKSFAREPFRMVFASWVGDTYAINTIDLKEPTQFLRIGDTIRGTEFKLIKFTEKYEPDKYGTDVDVSELTLEHGQTREQLTLVKEKTAISPESVATFIYLWGGEREFAVRKDQEFSLPPREEIKYKLVDVQPSKAVLVNPQKPNERIEIPLRSP